MNQKIQKRTELQKELGYRSDGNISPIALLGLFGESAEVLHECMLVEKENAKLIYPDEFLAATSVGAIIDNIKKKIRKNPDNPIQVIVSHENLDAFDLEVADTLYYLNIIALNRGKTLGDYADLAFEKVSKKMAACK